MKGRCVFNNVEKAKKIVRDAVGEYSDKCDFLEEIDFEDGEFAFLVEGEFDREGYLVHIGEGKVVDCVVLNGQRLSDWVES